MSASNALTCPDDIFGKRNACNPDARVGTDDWSAEQFQTQHLPAFIERCAAWRRRYETRNKQAEPADNAGQQDEPAG